MRSPDPRVLACALSIATTAATGDAQPVGRDFNADGVLDYPVSVTGFNTATPQNGAVRLWSGASKSAIRTIVSAEANTLFGYSVESAGDIDGDGYDDVVVGEPLWGTAYAWEGRIHVYSGATGSSLLTITGSSFEAGLGRYVTGIGDWNGDGTVDIASSGWMTFDTDADGHTDDAIGVVSVFSGVDGAVLAEIADAGVTERFGFGVFGLGDVDGDGLADIAITDPRAPGAPGSGATGAYYVYTGRAGTHAALDLSDAEEAVLNSDPGVRTFAAQIDTLHPNRWLDEATLQVLSLTFTDEKDGVNTSEFRADILALSGAAAGSKGVKPRLLDPGDIDMNGTVDSADLLASAGQFGTSPNVLGVMPVADVNRDDVVDSEDVGAVLASFGATSNIFEDLWRDDRLRSIGGGAAGFGSMPAGGGFSPAGPVSPHPIDDCITLTAGPDESPNALVGLLTRELLTNCRRCPDCDAVGPIDCYVCADMGDLSGGEIGVDKPQPRPGETVTFSLDPIVLSGGYDRCKVSCGGTPDGDGDTCAHFDGESREFTAGWVIEKLNPTTGEWDPYKSSEAGDSPTVQGQSCEEYRLRRLELTIDAPTEDTGTCTDLTHPEATREIQFASFTLAWECFSRAPSNRQRSLLGIGEEVRVWVVEPGAGDAEWSVPAGQGFYEEREDDGDVYIARSDTGHGEIIATINGCRRKIPFSVIEPTGINYQSCDTSPWHDAGQMNAWGHLKMDLDPDTVSFYNVATLELSAPPVRATGSFTIPVEEGGIATFSHSSGSWIYSREDNTLIGRDTIWIAVQPVAEYADGTMDWEIPVAYSVAGPNGIVDSFPDKTLQSFRVYGGSCVSVSKGGYTPDFCASDPDSSSEPPCPPTGW